MTIRVFPKCFSLNSVTIIIIFSKRIAVLESAISSVRNQHSTLVPQGHW